MYRPYKTIPTEKNAKRAHTSAVSIYPLTNTPHKKKIIITYSGAAFSSITLTSYAISFNKLMTATGNATITITDVSVGSVVATITGQTWQTGSNSVTITSGSAGISNWVAPVGAHSYTITLTDVADGYTTTSAPYVFTSLAFLTDIGTLGLWIDASQTSTITASGGSVSAISEPSGLAHQYSMVVSGTSTPYPTTSPFKNGWVTPVSQNTLSFSTNTGYIGSNVIMTGGTTAGYSFFVVFQVGGPDTPVNNYPAIFSMNPNSLTSGSESGLQIWTNENANPATGALRLDGVAATTGSQSFPGISTTVPNIFSGYVAHSTGNTNQGTYYTEIFLNGNQNGNVTTYAAWNSSESIVTSSLNFMLNVINNSIGEGQNVIGEVVVFQHSAGVVLPVASHNSVLLYLRSKWGTTGSGMVTYA